MLKKFLRIEEQLTQSIAVFLEKHLILFLGGSLTAFGGLLVYKALVDAGFFGDQIEHLHAAYLVSIGQVPYSDFFEHHHPLLWYLLAPILHFFYPSLKVIFFSRFLALGLLAGCLWLLFAITDKFLFDRKTALLSVLCLLCFPKVLTDSMNLRPDTFMILTVLGGLYCFFAYMQNGRLRNLISSYLLWVISFLFLQKAIIIGVGFGVANLWLLYQKKMPWRDFLTAAGIAHLPLAGFAAWLTYHQIWGEYWWYNWTLNHLMTEYFSGYTEIHPWVQNLLWLEIILAAYIYKRLAERMSIMQKVWLCCTLSAFGFTIWFMPHLQYLLSVVFLLAPFVGYFVKYIVTYPIKYLVLVLCLVGNFIYMYPDYMDKRDFKIYMRTIQYFADHLPQNAEFVGQTHEIFNIYYPNAHYYWFGFREVAMLDVLFNPALKDFNIMRLIEQKKPQYLAYEWVKDAAATRRFHWFAERNGTLIERIKKEPAKFRRFFNVTVPPIPSFWPVDDKYLLNNYENIKETHIWRRKDVAPQ